MIDHKQQKINSFPNVALVVGRSAFGTSCLNGHAMAREGGQQRPLGEMQGLECHSGQRTQGSIQGEHINMNCGEFLLQPIE